MSSHTSTLEWLKEECSALKYGQCSTRACMVRGGWKPGEGDWSKATCPAYEATRAINCLDEIVAFCDDPNPGPESLAMGLARLLPDARAALTSAHKGGE